MGESKSAEDYLWEVKSLIFIFVLLERLKSHRDSGLSRPGPANKAGSVNELGVRYTSNLAELSTAQTSPRLAKRYTNVKSTLRCSHGLDLPHLPLVLSDQEFEFALHSKFFLDLKDVVFPRSPRVHCHHLTTRMELLS